MEIKQFLIGIFLSVLCCGWGFGQEKDDQIIIPNRENLQRQQDKPYVILISIDGFRNTYFKEYHPKFLNKMRRKGVYTPYMNPSFPSVTFPNHYTIVTGLTPPHHGVVGNSMYDPVTDDFYSIGNAKAVKDSKWYGGTPIWSLAESQGLLTACFYWPGSEAKIAGYYPTYYYPYSETKGIAERAKRVKDWLELPEDKRPHLITFYFPDVDHAGHQFGPDALETANAVRYVDRAVKYLYKKVKETGLLVNFVVVSDHGMTPIDTRHPLKIPELDKGEGVVVSNGSYVSLFVKDVEKRDSIYKTMKEKNPEHYRVYLKENVPEKYHFSTSDDRYNRVGDIVLIAEAPYYFANPKYIPKGSHGFLPEDTPDMRAIFLAWGPNFKRHKKVSPFQNIQIFPVLADLLGLKIPDNIDGDEQLAREILRK